MIFSNFRLKLSAFMYCFIRGRRMPFFLLCLMGLLLNAHSAPAFFSDGKIDDDFSYRSLHIEMVNKKHVSKRKHVRCYLEGEILNNTNMRQEGVAITVYAYDFFDHTLWKETVHISIIDSYYNGGKSHYFQQKLHDCDEPAKFTFKVSGVRGKNSKKAIPAKSKSGNRNSDSRKSRPKDDLNAVDSAPKNVITNSVAPAAPVQNYSIVLTNGKVITTDAYREQNNMVFFNKDGGEIGIGKDTVSEIKKIN